MNERFINGHKSRMFHDQLKVSHVTLHRLSCLIDKHAQINYLITIMKMTVACQGLDKKWSISITICNILPHEKYKFGQLEVNGTYNFCTERVCNEKSTGNSKYHNSGN